ncbi:glycosyltransferase [Domibacillus indicus]|uniref:glycosyltransferase n=1 Tax=Domibacillus indicus TaxID=1437523 RepID=UPI000696D882|nr:glycosyltransferase [Domibacillus indicus]
MVKKMVSFLTLKKRGQEKPYSNYAKEKFIFHDDTGRRWPVSVLVLVLTVLFLSTVTAVITSSLFDDPNVTPVNFDRELKAVQEPLNNEAESSPPFVAEHQYRAASIPKNEASETYGFYLRDNTSSQGSLKQNIDSLDVIIPNWYYINSEGTIKKEAEKKVDAVARKENIKIIPAFELEEPEDIQMMQKALQSTELRGELVKNVHDQVQKDQYQGINLDFSGIPEEDKNAVNEFVKELSIPFKESGLQIIITATPEGGPYDFEQLSAFADRIIVTAYDEHYESSEAGPVASAGWTQKMLKDLPIPADKLILGIANIGYDWIENSNEPAKMLSYEEIMKMASESNLTVQWDENSRNPYLRYKENNENHIVWFLDGVTSYNQIKMGLDQGARGVAIRSLGFEEKGIWSLLKNEGTITQQADELKTIENLVSLSDTGSGEVITFSENTGKGSRTIHLDGNGFIDKQTYMEFPVHRFVERHADSTDKKIAITFDDGPDPLYTPKILDILSEKGVPATFFVLGKQTALYPDIAARIKREGHDIGSHTFSHTNIEEDSPWMIEAELNATQWLIQQTTGHSTSLFRPPYTTDADYAPNELGPILTAQNMGYHMVGSLIDTRDWGANSAGQIVETAVSNVDRGNILLLHDAGGDRSITVEALPKIIDELRKEGYTFVTVSSLMGKSQSEIMPPVQNDASIYMVFYKIASSMYSFLAKFSVVFFTGAIIFGIVRLLFLLFFSSRHRKNYQKRKIDPDYQPAVTVIIPAYNEEKVIEGTVHSILKSDYENFEIMVVDDGSSDRTAEVVRTAFSSDERVRLIVKANGGKSSAINRGFKDAKGEVIIILDADTSIASNSISLLASYFADEQVAAVSGNVKIGNVRNLLTTWQHVEYVTGFNLEKRAFDELNAITVVPGAIGAWRKSAVEEAGFFAEDTLAEDTDITIQVLRNGYRVKYEPNAYAYTEAPEDMKTFIKQRFRWSYGILQCLWKHRGALFNSKQKTLGFIGLPNMWSQYGLQALAPLADIVFIIGLFGDAPKILAFYSAFLLLDMLVAYYSFKLEKVSARPLIWLFLQRFVYRQFLTFTIWKSFTFVLKGVMVGWNKFDRSGNVRLPLESVAESAKRRGA